MSHLKLLSQNRHCFAKNFGVISSMDFSKYNPSLPRYFRINLFCVQIVPRCTQNKIFAMLQIHVGFYALYQWIRIRKEHVNKKLRTRRWDLFH